MSVRTKYLLGEIPVTINDNDKTAIIITVARACPQIYSLKGRGFSFTKTKQITCKCTQADYKTKIKELEKLLFEIEFKTLEIEETIEKEIKKKKPSKKAVKNENINPSVIGSGDTGGNPESDKPGDIGDDKKE